MRLIVAAISIASIAVRAEVRTFPISNTSTPQAQLELATIVRSLLDLEDVHNDASSMTLTVSGSQYQIASTAWLLAELDKPTPTPNLAPHASGAYEIPGSTGDAIRVFYLRASPTPPTTTPSHSAQMREPGCTGL